MFHPSRPIRPGISTKSRDTDNSASVYVVEVFSGETAILPCPPPPSDPPATITFYKNGMAVSESGKWHPELIKVLEEEQPEANRFLFLVFVDRVRLLDSGNLHIIDVKDADFGQYTCRASNHITAEVIESQRILKLVVKTPPSKSRPSTLAWTPEETYISQIGTFSHPH